jgi:hypothetical protein
VCELLVRRWRHGLRAQSQGAEKQENNESKHAAFFHAESSGATAVLSKVRNIHH